MTNNENLYWNNYYKSGAVPDVPSQFAVFVANEHKEIRTVVDIGCGNGRDSLFFMKLGMNVVGVDSSQSAIDVCNTKSNNNGTVCAYICDDIGNKNLPDVIISKLNEMKIDGNVVLYSRFFVHAIDEESEDSLIELFGKVLSRFGGVVALEFRTERDKSQPKFTASHYRRFVSPVRFFSKVEKNGFSVEYFTEGFGFAKFKNDDAHVARFILQKSN